MYVCIILCWSVCIHVCALECVCVCLCYVLCGGLVSSQLQVLSTLFFEAGSPSDLEPTNYSKLDKINEFKGFTSLHLPIAEVTSAFQQTQFLYVESEDQTQVHMHS